MDYLEDIMSYTNLEQELSQVLDKYLYCENNYLQDSLKSLWIKDLVYNVKSYNNHIKKVEK